MVDNVPLEPPRNHSRRAIFASIATPLKLVAAAERSPRKIPPPPLLLNAKSAVCVRERVCERLCVYMDIRISIYIIYINQCYTYVWSVRVYIYTHMYMYMYSLLHVECPLITISDVNLLGLFSTERGKRDLEN